MTAAHSEPPDADDPRPSCEGRLDSFSDLDDVTLDLAALVSELADPWAEPGAPRRAVPPSRIGRYTVLHRVGHGGMGVVFAAHDDALDRRVAIKLVRGVGPTTAPGATAHLHREAQALAKLCHPNVVAVHEVGVHAAAPGDPARAGSSVGPLVFIVMEFVVGKTLRAWWCERPRSDRTVLDTLVQAGRGLVAVHRAGLVHRDVKPENIMVGDDGRVRLMDFGLARDRFEARGPVVTPTAATRARALLGTPAYMAPEQFDAPEVGPAADQFALGVVAWEALFGARPFVGHTVEQLRAALRGPPRAPVRSPAIAPSIRRALERAIAIDPAARWPDVDALLDALVRGPG